MDTAPQQTLVDAFNQLPSVVQRAILSSELDEKMKQLAEKHKIHLDKWTVLEDEITLALFGITAPEQLVENIVKNVGLDQETAVAINNDAVEIIFNPVRKQLQDSIEQTQKGGGVIPVEQQKVMSELGVPVPNGNITTRTSLQNILKQRLDQKTDPNAKTINNASDSASQKNSVGYDPYRELPQ